MLTTNKLFNTYVILISVIGISIFLLCNHFDLSDSQEMVLLYSFLGAILLLNYHTIPIPPEGNSLSMDSTVYLAALFLFGLDFVLSVLVLNAMIYAFCQRKVIWWKHVFNFAIYTLMIVSSYYSFIFFGGDIGSINTTNLLPYLASLSIYFIVNTILISFYFLLHEKESFANIFNGILADKSLIVSYSSTLLLSIVLGTLVQEKGIFGLFIFACIALLLSIAFNQNFRLYQEISKKANRDFLTGLNNHGFFKELLEKQLSGAKETNETFSIALLDLDDFKKYNDIYGHIKGDSLLRDFGRLLEEQSGKRNHTVARYGGEEFAILMPGTNSIDARLYVNQIRKLANDTHFYGVQALPYGCLSFSAGIAQYDKGAYNTAELLHKADQAMYLAKSKGKNLVEIYNEVEQPLTGGENSYEKQFEDAEQQLKIFLSKDVYTYSHSKRVFQYAVDFARKLKLNEHERKVLTLGALVHDIGKLEIPRDILNKTGKLEPHEWEMMKKHVTWGKEIISTSKQLEELIPVVELHHERYDGKGYPYGLKEDGIPKLARILCIIDSFDAMTTERPYQKTKTLEEAIVELRSCAGHQFDKEYVEPFIELIEEQYC
jgi:diguanylate cyclase (GGDEF)-like protein/putative nucleotidyltransferase with HDIG domain